MSDNNDEDDKKPPAKRLKVSHGKAADAIALKAKKCLAFVASAAYAACFGGEQLSPGDTDSQDGDLQGRDDMISFATVLHTVPRICCFCDVSSLLVLRRTSKTWKDTSDKEVLIRVESLLNSKVTLSTGIKNFGSSSVREQAETSLHPNWPQANRTRKELASDVLTFASQYFSFQNDTNVLKQDLAQNLHVHGTGELQRNTRFASFRISIHPSYEFESYITGGRVKYSCYFGNWNQLRNMLMMRSNLLGDEQKLLDENVLLLFTPAAWDRYRWKTHRSFAVFFFTPIGCPPDMGRRLSFLVEETLPQDAEIGAEPRRLHLTGFYRRERDVTDA